MPKPFHTLHAGLLAFCVGVAVTLPLHAQDIFLRSNKDNSPSNKPAVEYGLRPSQPAAQPPANPAPPPPPVNSAAPAPTPSPAPAPYVPPQAPAAPTPPAYMPPSINTGSSNDYFSSQTVNKDVTVYKLGDDPAPDPGTGSSVFQINFQPGLIGAQDKNLVMQSLGLTDQELQSSCFFRYNTLLSYGQSGGSYLQSGTATSASRRFSGSLTTVQVYPSVACRKLRTPQSGMIVEQGNYYITTLSAVDCPPGAKGNSGAISLVFRYTGDGQGECRYQ